MEYLENYRKCDKYCDIYNRKYSHREYYTYDKIYHKLLKADNHMITYYDQKGYRVKNVYIDDMIRNRYVETENYFERTDYDSCGEIIRLSTDYPKLNRVIVKKYKDSEIIHIETRKYNWGLDITTTTYDTYEEYVSRKNEKVYYN